MCSFCDFFFSSRRRHTRCALVTGVQTCALPISREVIFTSGATESNNLAIKGAARFHRERRPHAVTLASEHKCVLESVEQLAREGHRVDVLRSEEHTSELQSLMRNSYAVFCLKKKKKRKSHLQTHRNTESTTK